MPVLLETLDQKIASTLAEWNTLTTLLALTILTFLAYPILYPDEPDTHPLLLARQATASPVRQKNESAVYRSPEIPHGYPLKSGLNVKDEGEPRWKSGRDGDLRDVWREVVRGGKVGVDGKVVPSGLIMSVHGKEEVEEHEVGKLSGEINVLGKFLKERGVERVAVYLPNSVEYLLAIFACSFYGLTPVLLPYNQSYPKVYELINATGADALVCAAGTLPLDDLVKECSSLRSVTWVVEKTSRHMDWSSNTNSPINVSVWHELVEKSPSTSPDLPKNTSDDKPLSLITAIQPPSPSSKPTITTYAHANLVSAIAANLTSLPLRQRLNPADLVLPADSLSQTYILTWTLAALYAHTSLALTSVAGPGVSLALASRSVSPTVILASPATLLALHQKETGALSSNLQKLGNFTQQQALSAGRMPTDTLLFKLLAPSTSSTKPGQLRLILTSTSLESSDDGTVLTSTQLSDLRIFTRSRIVHALTAPGVAGAISASHVFDYRREDGTGHARFGAPVGSVEVKVVSGNDEEVGAGAPVGELVVSGPAVVGGVLRTGSRFRVGEDGCLGVVS